MRIRSRLLMFIIFFGVISFIGMRKNAEQTENMEEYQQAQSIQTGSKVLATLEDLREKMNSEDKRYGVAYLGCGYDRFPLMNSTKIGKKYQEKYPFLSEVPIVNCVDCSGDELYCVVPADAGAKIMVYHYEMDGCEQWRKGEVLYEGTPECILLAANCSDLYPNTCVVIQCMDGEQFEFIPKVSLMDGCLCPGNNQEIIYDFSDYDLIRTELMIK